MNESDKPGVSESEGQGSGNARTPRNRTRSRTSARPAARPASRPANPTRSIEPGVFHYKIAEGVLSQLQQRASDAGIPLDIGEFPTTEASANGDDPEQIARLVAHAVARIGDKFRFLRRFSRHLEGADKRAGLLSDFAAAAYALYKRNPDAAEHLAKNFAAEVKSRRAEVVLAKRQAASPENQQTQPQGAPK